MRRRGYEWRHKPVGSWIFRHAPAKFYSFLMRLAHSNGRLPVLSQLAASSNKLAAGLGKYLKVPRFPIALVHCTSPSSARTPLSRASSPKRLVPPRRLPSTRTISNLPLPSDPVHVTTFVFSHQYEVNASAPSLNTLERGMGRVYPQPTLKTTTAIPRLSSFCSPHLSILNHGVKRRGGTNVPRGIRSLYILLFPILIGA